MNSHFDWSRYSQGDDAFRLATVQQATGSSLKIIHFRGGEIVYDSDETLVLSMGLTAGHTLEYGTGGLRTRVVPIVGRFGLMTPGRRFHVRLQGDCSVLQMVVPRRRVVRWLEEDHAVDPRAAEIVWGHSLDDPAIGRLLLKARLGDVDEEEIALRGVATRLFERFSARPRPLPRSRGGLAPCDLRRILERIEADVARPIAVDDLAREVALTRSTSRASSTRRPVAARTASSSSVACRARSI